MEERSPEAIESKRWIIKPLCVVHMPHFSEAMFVFIARNFKCHRDLISSLLTATSLPHDNVSVRLFSIILWLSATYVLSDLYSAQLTSQLARPSKERAINTLQRLEHVLNASEGYDLLVEKNSASHNVLMNGTGIMLRLFQKMERQGSKYLLNSVEEGVYELMNRDKTAVFAGRQTLFFNMKRFGFKNFQLSEKLFTRYSAITLQKGCLFLDSINDKYESVCCE